MPSVVPEQPLGAVKDGEGFVAGIVIPLVFTWTNDGIGTQAFPLVRAVWRASDTDLSMVGVPEPDIKHQVPAAARLHLAGGDFMVLPLDLRIRLKHRIRRRLCPGNPVGAGRIPYRVWLILLASRIPHAKYPG